MQRSELRPGDALLYKPTSVWSYAIAIKTWHDVSHCEAYVGGSKSVASRDGIGVGLYDLRIDGLLHVLRPPQSFDWEAAMDWFHAVNGQGYDWKGLLRFFTWGAIGGIDTHDKMFCSEFLTRWYRAGGCDPFNRQCDADSVAPAQFLYLASPWECHAFEY